QGQLARVKLSMNPSPSISLPGGWGLVLSDGSIDQAGLKVSGNINFPVPGSDNSSLSFSNLSINNNGISGGSLNLPQNGIDLYGITHIQSSNPFGLQSVPGGGFAIKGTGNF